MVNEFKWHRLGFISRILDCTAGILKLWSLWDHDNHTY